MAIKIVPADRFPQNDPDLKDCCLTVGDKTVEGKYAKDPDTGDIDICLAGDPKVTPGKAFKLTLKNHGSAEESEYAGHCDKDGCFCPGS